MAPKSGPGRTIAVSIDDRGSSGHTRQELTRKLSHEDERGSRGFPFFSTSPREGGRKYSVGDGGDSPSLYDTRPYNSRSSRARSPSICSRTSSRNSPLRGSREFDRDYQRPTFSGSRAGSASSYEIPRTKPGLPPPPKSKATLRRRRDVGGALSKADVFEAAVAAAVVEANSSSSDGDFYDVVSRRRGGRSIFSTRRYPRYIPSALLPKSTSEDLADSEASSISGGQPPQQTQTTCYVCSTDITINRRKDWQIHLIHDLKPYVCFIRDCPSASESYSSYNDLLDHVRAMHPSADIFDTKSDAFICPFCDDLLLQNVRQRFKHLGRHMEEISFAVVPRNHEDWEFYNDSDISTGVDEIDPTSRAEKTVHKPKQKIGSSQPFTVSHKTNVHQSFKSRALLPQVVQAQAITGADRQELDQAPESLRPLGPSLLAQLQRATPGTRHGGARRARRRSTEGLIQSSQSQNETGRSPGNRSSRGSAATGPPTQSAEQSRGPYPSAQHWQKLFQDAGLTPINAELCAIRIVNLPEKWRADLLRNLKFVNGQNMLRNRGGLSNEDARKVVALYRSRQAGNPSGAETRSSVKSTLERISKQSNEKGSVVSQWMNMMRSTPSGSKQT